jgi:adenylate cyclase
MTMNFKSIIISALISLVTSILVILLFYSNFFKTYELKSLDLFQKLNAPLEDPGVVIVEIDQKSLTAVSQQGIHWPWPRQMYAPLIEVCTKAGTKGILFDIIFSEPSSYGREDDLEFARAIRGAQNVYLPMNMSIQNKYQIDILPIEHFGIKDNAPARLFREARSYVPPIEALADEAKGLGNVIIPPDRDGVYRRVSLFTRYKEYLFPSLTVTPVTNRMTIGERNILFDGNTLFVNHRGELLLHYYGAEFQFPRFNVLEIISAYQNPDSPQSLKVASRIKDRFIIIALTAPGLYDLKPTSVTSVSPGAYVHGILLTNLLRGHHIRQMNDIWTFILIFVLGLILGLSIITLVSFWKNSLIFLLFIMGWPLISFVLFYYYQYWTGLLSYEVAFFTIFGLTSTYSYQTEGKKRKIIRQLFSHYMSEILVKELEAHPQKATLGGDRRFITIFFSDLDNFTRLSEQFEPEKIVGLLNSYFTEMSRIIFDSQGLIDKFQGDGIMAFWGAPIPLQDHAALACLAALQCQENMEEINNQLRNESFPPLSMRIGLHSGDAIVGNMGSEQKFDYTIIGDHVNLASRLEGVNKRFGTKILLSETTYHLAKEQIEARELDLIAVKGKEKPIRIFQLLGEKNKIPENAIKVTPLFEDGLKLYRTRDFAGAQEMFEKVMALSPNDQPAQLFIERCHHLKEKPPPREWDGVFRLKEK